MAKMVNEILRRRQFIAETAAFYPALYSSTQRLHNNSRQFAYDQVQWLAEEAGIPEVNCE